MSDDLREEFAEIVAGLKEHLAATGGELRTWTAASQAPAAAPSASVPPAAPAPVKLQTLYQSAAPKPAPAAPAPIAAKAPAGRTVEISGGDPAEALRKLRDETIGDCRICPLGATRIKLAFGVGNPGAPVMLVGEGPGYMEDRQGEPFVGPAGQLLDKILDAIQLSRQPKTPAWQWVYIANIVKCHPMKDPSTPDARGNDRPPAPEEIEKCFPFLAAQIRIVRPKFILSLGATAAKALLNSSRGITGIHGQWFDFSVEGCEPIRLLPTYHPAALLRDPSLKKDVWADVKKLRDELLAIYGPAK